MSRQSVPAEAFKYPIRPRLLQALAGLPDDAPDTRPRDGVWLDANESPYNTPLNRYPEAPEELEAALGRIRGISPEQVFACRGTADAIQLLLQLCCTPGHDNVVTTEPTFSPVRKLCTLFDVECRTARLDELFHISADTLLQTCNERTRILFLCSPNNPTGNLLKREEVIRAATLFRGLVVVDETYVDFSRSTSLLPELTRLRNLVVVRSFSATLASAGLCISTIYAPAELLRHLRSIRPAHYLSTVVQTEGLKALRRYTDADRQVAQILDERAKVMAAFRLLPCCETVYHSDANYFMARMRHFNLVLQRLAEGLVCVTDCSRLPGCTNCIRVTIGLSGENSRLIGILRGIM